MRLAYFHTNTILSSWTNLAIAQTLRRMGHTVFEGAIPVNDHGAVLNRVTRREFQNFSAGMPTLEELASCDLILVWGPEYITHWINALYGAANWKDLPGIRVATYLETSHRAELDFHYEYYREWFDVHFYPAAEDLARFGGLRSTACVDTEMFRPQNMEALECGAGSLNSKKYETAFVGTIYAKRIEFLQRLLPLIGDVDFHLGSVTVMDIDGERHLDWARILVENMQHMRIHLALPSNNIRMMVARPMETMACGTFLLTYRTPDNLFQDGVHCRFYDPENVKELAQMIHYYLSHEAEREGIARAGCLEVRSRFSLEKRLKEVLELSLQHPRQSGERVLPAFSPRIDIVP